MTTTFTEDDLTRILREGSGDSAELSGEISDREFEELGYDSLALLETLSRIKREYGAQLDEESALAATTPRALVDLVNQQLRLAV